MARIAEKGRGDSAIPIAEAELRPGEKLVWADRPAAMVILRRELPMGLIGLPVAAFAVFWIAQAARIAQTAMTHNAGVLFYFFPLWGLIFVGMGLYLLARPFASALRAGSTVYGITDQRLFILTGSRLRRVASYSPGQIGTLERTDRADGSGDIIFRKEALQSNFRSGVRTTVNNIGFFGVPEVRRVEVAIQALAATAKQG